MRANKNLPIINEFSSGVVIFRENDSQRKYLILHYPGGHFDFPKGHLEAGETEEMAALREVLEETGLTIQTLNPDFREVMTYDFNRQDHRVHKTVTFFLAETTSADIKISFEHKGYLWLNYEETLAKITFNNARQILKLAEALINNQKLKQ